MGLIGAHAQGATPLNADDVDGLIPDHITTQKQLNEWEEENILKAKAWLRSSRAKQDPLDEAFIFELHRRMFDETWKWAGTTRTRETNIGVDPSEIRVKVREALADVREQLKRKPGDIDQIAALLHHRLVKIHPFRNGNGRHGRLIVDLLLAANGRPEFTWGMAALKGNASLASAGPVRDTYIRALRAADGHDYAPLFEFVRS